MRIPKIFFKIFAAIFVLTAIYILFVFYFFIPKIENKTIFLENSLGKAQLQKTVQLVDSYAERLEEYEAMALESRKDELKQLTDVIYDIVEVNYKQSLQNPAKTQELQQNVLNLVSKIKYANNDYFYISDYNSTLLSHPYLQGQNFSNVTDIYGNLIVPKLVEIAKKDNEGYIRYWWKKNTIDNTPYEKLTYARNFAPWQWVIGTGVYIDDIHREVQKRKNEMIGKLKTILNNTKIGNNGYVYIFDENGNMIIHKNKELEGKNFRSYLNPGKSTYIIDDLIKAYKSGEKTLYYDWDKPNDRGNFKYKKVSWIEYEPYFKWYICSSEYIDEAYADSENLKDFMIYSILIMVVLIILLGLYFLKQIFEPVLTLAHNAQEVIDGNLDARYTDKIRNDEIGLLALQYNTMLDRIKEQMETLDTKVKEKTQKLRVALNEKELLLKEVNHRVKNNLNVISSIIGLQAFHNNDKDMQYFIETIQHRIHSMSIAHEMLSKKSKVSSLDVEDYIRHLVESLIEAYTEDPSSCKCIYEIDELHFDLDTLLSCGLIVNELVTNAIKYALLQEENYLKITIKEDGNNIILSVKDNGKGLQKGEGFGVGLELVAILTEQLQGSMRVLSGNGTEIIINFPKPT